MHEQEQTIVTTDHKVPVMERFTSLKEGINTSPKKAIIASAGTLLTLTACSPKQAEEVVNAVCPLLTFGVLGYVIYEVQVGIPGHLDKAEETLRLQNLIDTGSIDSDDWELIEYAERFHHKNVTLTLDVVRDYSPNPLTLFLIDMRHRQRD